jgi:hypothetical protein
MQDEIERALAELGGSQLVDRFRENVLANPAKPLPKSEIDGFSIGYAIAIGGIAVVIDLVMDNAFRDEMQGVHKELSPKEQQALERKIKAQLEELGLKPETGQPGMAMDWYQKLNEALGLKSPYQLRPSNHRILNHTDLRTVIEMLMKGEAGIGDMVWKIFPEMTEEAARKLLEMHLQADRCSPASLPLRLMSWFWEQCMRAGNPATVGEPSMMFQMFGGVTKNVDWSKWCNKFFGEGLVPPGANIGEAMLKLYDTGALSQRVFWTSDLGAAVGGLKRRLLIATFMELGVELFAFLEGVKKGRIAWEGDIATMASQVKVWRDQPKYLDMKIVAQGFAASGGATRALFSGDILQINYFSVGMMLKHLFAYPATERRQFQRMVEFSRNDIGKDFESFTLSTGIKPRPNLTIIEGGLSMTDNLEKRLVKAGCHSTRVRVLAVDFPDELKDLVGRIEAASKKASGHTMKERAFDAICESWYLSEEEDDKKAISQLKTDLASVERAVA